MTQITNLNRYRKDKARAEKKAQADANAASHGRTKAQKIKDAMEADKTRRLLDAQKFESED